MGISPGERVFFRLLPRMSQYEGTVVSASDTAVEIQIGSEAQRAITTGQYIVITDTDLYCYTEVVEVTAQSVKVRQIWQEKREYFRVDDVFPLLYRKVRIDDALRRSTLFAGFSQDLDDLEVIGDGISQDLLQVLSVLNRKLNLILEKLNIESEGLAKAESRHVNISAAGVKFSAKEPFAEGDIFELKMLLPTTPPTGILAYGLVVRVNPIGEGEFLISLNFIDMNEQVREEIIRYALNRQREIIRRQREKAD